MSVSDAASDRDRQPSVHLVTLVLALEAVTCRGGDHASSILLVILPRTAVNVAVGVEIHALAFLLVALPLPGARFVVREGDQRQSAAKVAAAAAATASRCASSSPLIPRAMREDHRAHALALAANPAALVLAVSAGAPRKGGVGPSISAFQVLPREGLYHALCCLETRDELLEIRLHGEYHLCNIQRITKALLTKFGCRTVMSRHFRKLSSHVEEAVQFVPTSRSLQSTR